jgi:hypothetical protein
MSDSIRKCRWARATTGVLFTVGGLGTVTVPALAQQTREEELSTAPSTTRRAKHFDRGDGGGSSRMPAPVGIPTLSRSIMKIEVSATGAPYPSWDAPVDLYFRRFDREWRLIGLERMPDGREILAERR